MGYDTAPSWTWVLPILLLIGTCLAGVLLLTRMRRTSAPPTREDAIRQRYDDGEIDEQQMHTLLHALHDQ